MVFICQHLNVQLRVWVLSWDNKCIYNYMFFNNMKLYVNAAVIIYGFAIFFSPDSDKN